MRQSIEKGFSPRVSSSGTFEEIRRYLHNSVDEDDGNLAVSREYIE